MAGARARGIQFPTEAYTGIIRAILERGQAEGAGPAQAGANLGAGLSARRARQDKKQEIARQQGNEERKLNALEQRIQLLQAAEIRKAKGDSTIDRLRYKKLGKAFEESEADREAQMARAMTGDIGQAAALDVAGERSRSLGGALSIVGERIQRAGQRHLPSIFGAAPQPDGRTAIYDLTDLRVELADVEGKIALHEPFLKKGSGKTRFQAQATLGNLRKRKAELDEAIRIGDEERKAGIQAEQEATETAASQRETLRHAMQRAKSLGLDDPQTRELIGGAVRAGRTATSIVEDLEQMHAQRTSRLGEARERAANAGNALATRRAAGAYAEALGLTKDEQARAMISEHVKRGDSVAAIRESLDSIARARKPEKVGSTESSAWGALRELRRAAGGGDIEAGNLDFTSEEGWNEAVRIEDLEPGYLRRALKAPGIRRGERAAIEDALRGMGEGVGPATEARKATEGAAPKRQAKAPTQDAASLRDEAAAEFESAVRPDMTDEEQTQLWEMVKRRRGL